MVSRLFKFTEFKRSGVELILDQMEDVDIIEIRNQTGLEIRNIDKQSIADIIFPRINFPILPNIGYLGPQMATCRDNHFFNHYSTKNGFKSCHSLIGSGNYWAVMFSWFISSNRKSKAASFGPASLNLIQRFSKGHTNTVEELYDLYFNRIYSMVYSQTGRDHNSAEEVVHETWIAVTKSIRSFKGKSSPYIWICSIAVHKITDYQCRSGSDKAWLKKPPTDPEIPELKLIDSSPLPEELIQKKETKEVVRMALDSLPIYYHLVITLKYMEKMSVKEIGQVLGKSTKSVESLLDRAELALRNEIVAKSR